MWRQSLRYQYLLEKLGRELSPTNSNVILPLTKTNYTDITDTLARLYRWNFHMATNYDSTDVLQLYLEALTHAYDPHSDYQNDAHAQDFKIQMSLSLAGIGASLSDPDGYCTISKLIQGGPADKSKQLNEKDRIIAVAQGTNPPVNVVDMELSKVVQQIRGPKGTEVRLTISPADNRFATNVISLVRDEIKLEDSEAKAVLIETPAAHGGTNRIGVINVPSFYAHALIKKNLEREKLYFRGHRQIDQEAQGRKKINGIVLDLRSNPGGSGSRRPSGSPAFSSRMAPSCLARRFQQGDVTVDSDTDSSVAS